MRGVTKPDSGEIWYNGENITTLPTSERVRLGIGYLPQKSCLFEELTINENIQIVSEFAKIGNDSEFVATKLDEFCLERVKNHKAKTLSGGERKKLEILLSLLTNPTFLLWDEPFTGIDPRQIREIGEIIEQLVAEGKGMLIVDHNYSEIIKKTDRIVFICDGVIHYDGPTRDFENSEVAKELYL